MSVDLKDILGSDARFSKKEIRALAGTLTEEQVENLRALHKTTVDRQPYLDARDSLLRFAQLMSPDRNEPDNPHKSRYIPAPHHKLIVEALEKVESGEMPRLIITMPPRHGKSELVTRIFPAWVAGKDPSREVIIAGYSQKFAERSFGKKIQTIMLSPRYNAVFPGAALDGGSKAVDALATAEGGLIAISGRDGAMTGLGANFLIIDDPIKNKKEAESEVLRETTWEWFTTTAMSRVYDGGSTVIVMTRWNEDDIVGRLTNPDHPDYDPAIAKGWEILCLPAIFEPQHEKIATVLGRKVGDVLWPKKGALGFTHDYFEVRRRLDASDFEALYQGNPSPMDGDFFKTEWLQTYSMTDLPKMQFLSTYGASDHGVTTKTRSDPSVIGCIGVDEEGTIYVLPDLFWDRVATDRVVEEIIAKMKFHKPFAWWMESENISKAFGPFLMKRMAETGVYTVIEPKIPSKDKITRAQSIRGLLAHKRIKFPVDAHWWPMAKRQLLVFPNGSADDFVDFMSWIGQGVMDLVPGKTQTIPGVNAKDRPGTLAWIKAQSALADRRMKVNGSRRIGY